MKKLNFNMKNQNTKHEIPNAKESKGITLVALILTIIILLILAVVAISAVNDGGIIQHAQNAKNEHTIAQEKEQIGLAQNEWNLFKYTNPDKTFLSFMTSKLVDTGVATNVDGPENGPLTVKMKSGREYTVTNSGEIVTGWYNNGDGTYTKGEETIEIGVTEYTNAEVLAKLGIEASEYEGTYGKNDGETWTVIGVEGDKIKLVSTRNVADNVILGYGDPKAPANLEEIFNKEGEETNLNLEKAIWSYINVENTLKEYAQDATKGIPGVRSIKIEDIYDIIGEENVNKGNLYGKVIRYTFSGEYVYSKEVTGADNESNPGNSTNKKSLVFVKNNKPVIINKENSGNVVDLICKSFTYTLSDTQKSAIGSLAKGNYWLASQSVFCRDLYVLTHTNFSVHIVYSGDINGRYLFDSDGDADSNNFGVRAVVYI